MLTYTLRRYTEGNMSIQKSNVLHLGSTKTYLEIVTTTLFSTHGARHRIVLAGNQQVWLRDVLHVKEQRNVVLLGASLVVVRQRVRRRVGGVRRVSRVRRVRGAVCVCVRRVRAVRAVRVARARAPHAAAYAAHCPRACPATTVHWLTSFTDCCSCAQHERQLVIISINESMQLWKIIV